MGAMIKCKKKGHKWSKWSFAAWKDGVAVERRRCKRCGKSQHRLIQCVASG